jgi:hypothetical protein
VLRFGFVTDIAAGVNILSPTGFTRTINFSSIRKLDAREELREFENFQLAASQEKLFAHTAIKALFRIKPLVGDVRITTACETHRQGSQSAHSIKFNARN